MGPSLSRLIVLIRFTFFFIFLSQVAEASSARCSSVYAKRDSMDFFFSLFRSIPDQVLTKDGVVAYSSSPEPFMMIPAIRHVISKDRVIPTRTRGQREKRLGVLVRHFVNTHKRDRRVRRKHTRKEVLQWLKENRESFAEGVDYALARLKERSETLLSIAQREGEVEVDVVVVGAGPVAANFLRGLAKSPSKKLPRVLVVSEAMGSPHFSGQSYLLNSPSAVATTRQDLNFQIGLPPNHLHMGKGALSEMSLFTGLRPFEYDSKIHTERYKWTPFQYLEGSGLTASDFIRLIKDLGGHYAPLEKGPDGSVSDSSLSGMVFMPAQVVSNMTILSLYGSGVPIITGVRVEMPATLEGTRVRELETSAGFKIKVAEGGVVVATTGSTRPLGSEQPFVEWTGVGEHIFRSSTFYERLARYNRDEISVEDVYEGLSGKGLVIGRGDAANLFVGSMLGVERGVPEFPSNLDFAIHWSQLASSSRKDFLKFLKEGSGVSRGPFHHLRYKALAHKLRNIHPVDLRVRSIERLSSDGNLQFKVTFENHTSHFYDWIADMTGAPPNLPAGNFRAIHHTFDGLPYRGAEATVAAQWSQSNAYFLGPALIPTLEYLNVPSTPMKAFVGTAFRELPITPEYLQEILGSYYRSTNPTSLANTSQSAVAFGTYIGQQFVNRSR